ncbi:MAG: aminotransferase class V-fold PLP-dependent enzyme [Mucilaginibacter sp.]
MILTTPSNEILDVTAVRQQFPILNRTINNKPLVYLDNAATSQKPMAVIDAITDYYTRFNANVHRGLHSLAEEATEAYEASRVAVQQFIGAAHPEEIIFTRGTTESINLVAYTWGRANIIAGDEVLISEMEHHANIVPWQRLCRKQNAVLKIIPVLDNGEICLESFHELLTSRTKLVAVAHASNVLGTINPVKTVIEAAHLVGAVVLLDGAQSAVHCEIDVKQLNCDFFAFSGHKVYGPSGIGVLYGKSAILNCMPVFHGGGEMIKEVSFERTTYNDIPYKFEAGTPNIAGAIALKSALDFIILNGKLKIRNHERALLAYATDKLSSVPGLSVLGTAGEKVSLVSFVVDGLHIQDIGVLLDKQGIAVRTGHHCAQPLMKRFGVAGTVRASFAAYNTFEEIDLLISGLLKAIKMLS